MALTCQTALNYLAQLALNSNSFWKHFQILNDGYFPILIYTLYPLLFLRPLALSNFLPFERTYGLYRGASKTLTTSQLLTWYGCVVHQVLVQNASQLLALYEDLYTKGHPFTWALKYHIMPIPCRRIVFCPLGERKANWSKVMISPPALRILALAPSVNRNAQICFPHKIATK